MSKVEVAHALPDYSSSPPPDYNATAADTERVIESVAFGSGLSPPLSLAGRSRNHTSTVHSSSYILVILPRSGHTSSARTGPVLAYGRQATISGLLSLAPGRWTSTIYKVAVSLTGKASSVLIRQGMREPASSRRLCFTSQVLWSKSSENAGKPSDKAIKFEFQIPESIPDGRMGHIDLPPTFDEKTQTVFGIATHVKIEYKLRVDVWRRGLWSNKRYAYVRSRLICRGTLIFLRNNSLSIPIIYLPKTYPAPGHMAPVTSLSIMDAKRFGLENEKWRQVNLKMPRSQFPDGGWSASIALPRGPASPGWRPIPIVVTVSRPLSPKSSVSPHSITPGEYRGSVAFSEGHTVMLGPGVSALEESFDLEVTLVKHINLHCSLPHPGCDWVNERVLGKAVVRKMTTNIERPKQGLDYQVVTTIHACISGGVERGETTWCLDGFVSVEVRQTIILCRLQINRRFSTLFG